MFHLVLESHDGRALGADSEEKHEPVSDIDAVAVDSLKVLDPKRPIREAEMALSSLACATPAPSTRDRHEFVAEIAGRRKSEQAG